jgi:hypothetical protein
MKFLNWHFFCWHSCNSLVIVVFNISYSSVRHLFCCHRCNIHWEIFLNDSYFFKYLWNIGPMLLIFFRYFSNLYGFLCFAVYFKKYLLFFHMTVRLHILCNVLCTKMIPKLNVDLSKNMISQKNYLIVRCLSEIK